MAKIDTIVVGASAGGVEALNRLVSPLPADLPAALFVVLHFPESSVSVLPTILSRSGPLPAHHAVDGETPENGTIYVAPPGRHMLLHNGVIRLVLGPKENSNRPAIDPLFRTAARSNRNRVVGILLSGLLDDGSLGQMAIQRHGGRTLCQDPAEAAFGDMPRNAIEYGSIDTVLPLDALAEEIVRLAGQPVEDVPGEEMPDPTEMTLRELHNLEERGEPSIFVCPECKGTLFQLEEEGVTHYRCHVGHSYLSESLSAEQETELEAALWTALRALKEHNELLKRMARRAEGQGFDLTAQGYRKKMEDGAHQIELLRHVLGLARREVGESAA
ncbi:chemotaxis protein CheB [bacterium]|nr:MAG: chemotaxis protein CheB [bacterium]